jgi:elongation factor P
MSSIQATRLKKGMLIKMNEDLYRVLDLQHVTPGNLRGFVRAKFRNIRNGTLSDQKLRSEDSVERATLDERQMQYLYKDGDSFHFMDTTTFEQLHIASEALGDSVNYIIPDAIITVEFYGSEPVGIELPQTVDLTVEDTVPGIKGATASALRQHRRQSSGEHRNRRVPLTGLIDKGEWTSHTPGLPICSRLSSSHRVHR